MPGGAHRLEARLARGPGVKLAGALRHDPVVIAPYHEGRRAHATEQMRQGLAVHVWLPRDPEAHLAAQIPGDQLVGRDLAVNPGECRLIVKPGARVVEIADDRLVE